MTIVFHALSDGPPFCLKNASGPNDVADVVGHIRSYVWSMDRYTALAPNKCVQIINLIHITYFIFIENGRKVVRNCVGFVRSRD